MIRPLLAVFLLLAFTFGPLTSHAAGTLQRLAVVVATTNPNNQLALDNIKLIFKRKAEVDGRGNRWIPLNLPVQDPIRRAFSEAVFDQLPEDAEAYWNEQYFNGITPPPVLASEEAVIRFVVATPGAIGYINWESVDQRVKVLHTLLIQRH